MGLADRLRFYRRTRKWTQRDLAARARMAAEQISRYESGYMEPRVNTTVRLARALKVSLSDLLGD